MRLPLAEFFLKREDVESMDNMCGVMLLHIVLLFMLSNFLSRVGVLSLTSLIFSHYAMYEVRCVGEFHTISLADFL